MSLFANYLQAVVNARQELKLHFDPDLLLLPDDNAEVVEFNAEAARRTRQVCFESGPKYNAFGH